MNNDNNDTGSVVKKLVFVVIGMFGFGFALVPIYDVFCEITGLNGKTVDEAAVIENMQVDTSREVTVQFVSHLNAGMPWEFEPATRVVRVNPGQSTKVEYVARNMTDRVIIGHAVPSVAPGLAAPYLQKTECFCFNEQRLEANEEKNMPVVFVVDPELPEDIETLTLAYTFFVKKGSETELVSMAQN